MPKTKKPRKSTLSRRGAVPYARGFHPPSKKLCRDALGSKEEEIGREFQPDDSLFPALPHPTSIDDWLAQYVESGQTYQQYLAQCPWLSSRKTKYVRHKFIPEGRTITEKYPEGKIYLLPLGEFEGNITPRFTDLAEYCRVFYSIPVEVLPAVRLAVEGGQVLWEDRARERNPSATRHSTRATQYKIQTRFHSGRYQLQVGSLLYKLRQTIPSDSICVVGLTMSELYDEDGDLFVAGMAAGNQRVGVFSFSRYQPGLSFSPELWYQVQKEETRLSEGEQKQILLGRSCKLLVHEIAHLLGLDHCIWHSCCMNGSGHLREDFEQPMHLCPVDLRKLQRLCGFGVVERYRGLQDWYRSHGLAAEESWVAQRLDTIAN